jgi:methylated-DNA-[protein]-cysteine S-methyltransferase
MPATLTVESPLGLLAIRAEGDQLTSLDWADAPAEEKATDVLREAAKQLLAYFDGRITAFDLPLAPKGTAHQQAVWSAMLRIPYGGFTTYGEIADELNSSARAIGAACGRNPIPVIVPCHRVIETGGGMGGYSGRGGLETKRALLLLEGAMLA